MGDPWEFPHTNVEAAENLRKKLGCLPVIAQILWRRGYRDPEVAEAFLSPLKQPIPIVRDLTDLPAAVDRIRIAKEREEYVRVFADYDVDGVSAAAIMLRALRRLGITRVDCYVPERETDGYGISAQHVHRAAEAGVNLIVTVDNGITAHDAAETANELGVDMIITDHHHAEAKIPRAFACVNPKRDGDGHAFQNVAGSTVAWIVANELTGNAEDDLALVALGTVADVMPLIGVNRTLVAHGLHKLSLGTFMGITALAGKAGVDLRELRAEHIAFQLAPRLNAAGRMGCARSALDLLLAEESRDAARLSRTLDEANAARRELERAIEEKVTTRLEADLSPKSRTIVVGDRGWPRGVLGIVAAKVAEKYNRPAALLSFDDNGLAYASARSRPGFDLIEALTQCSGRLIKYGGHQGAAGFTISQEQIAAFSVEFERTAARQAWDASSAAIEVDAILPLAAIDGELLRGVEQLGPFGQGNPDPIFCTCGVKIPPASVRRYNGGHLGLSVEDEGRQFPAIGFRMGDLIDSLQSERTRYDVLYRPKYHTFRGRTSIQLQIQSIRRQDAGIAF